MCAKSTNPYKMRLFNHDTPTGGGFMSDQQNKKSPAFTGQA